MTRTAQELGIDSIASAATVGQYARFDAFGRFLRFEGYLSNGLGLIYRKNADGTFTRVFY